jgi:uncharacterized membrane protein YfcA
MDIVLVSLMSALAGFVDAVVGGGGLILVPALFAAYPSAHPATLLGTNKSASVWGTLFAAWQYNRRVQLAWRALLVASLMAFVGSWAGAYLLTLVSPQYLRQALPAVLIGLLGYTLWNKQLGQEHAPCFAPRKQAFYMAAIGATIGFYDGFFGPGTGSFLVFLLVKVLGFDFLQASAHSKVLNLFSNLAAVILLASQGHVWWHVGIPLALANVVGSLLGSRMALKHGAVFVRWLFILVVAALAFKTARDAWFV